MYGVKYLFLYKQQSEWGQGRKEARREGGKEREERKRGMKPGRGGRRKGKKGERKKRDSAWKIGWEFSEYTKLLDSKDCKLWMQNLGSLGTIQQSVNSSLSEPV